MKQTGLSFFEKYLSIWVLLAIIVGTLTGYNIPSVSTFLNKFCYAQVSVPIAVCLFFMMFPIMVKIDFSRVKAVARTPRPVALTLIINWLIKPFTMYAITYFFLGYLFKDLIIGTEIINGESVAIYRSYISGAILLGIAPCTAMVLLWSYLSDGNDALTLVMVAVNSLLMLFLYAPLGGLLLSINKMPIPWKTILLSVLIYVGLPLISGYYTRKYILIKKGVVYFNTVFLHRLTPLAIFALLMTLIVLFILKGEVIVKRPFDIGLIAVPLIIQTVVIFILGYFTGRFIRLRYEDAAPAAMIGASNHFEVAIATSVMLFGLNSGAAMATVVGVLIEVPLMLMLVRFCLKTKGWFKPREESNIGKHTPTISA
ncbi:MAG: ACR3 family arsenite efflux transporter [Candidatus Zixiibacteriota bacterium]